MKKQKNTRIAILGGGISGLSTARYLSQAEKSLEITLIEKEKRTGGHLHTDKSTPFLFEKGPRTFQTARSSALLSLVKDLGLEKELIYSSKEAKTRYLLFQNSLHAIPSSPLKLFFSPLTKGIFSSLFRELRQPAISKEETIWEFASRRFSPMVAERFFDPLTLGIYAGDIKKLSVDACFPNIKEMEKTYGSIIKAMLFKKRKKETIPALFSFNGGTQTLIDALTEQSGCKLLLNQEVDSLLCKGSEIIIKTKNETIVADHVFSTLSSKTMSKLFENDEEIGPLFRSINTEDLTVVNIGFKEKVLSHKGFGYLVPSEEKQEILGVVFDSEIFSEHNLNPFETRLTVMIKGSLQTDHEYQNMALRALSNHLKISKAPDTIMISHAKDAIAQYEIGHLEKILKLKELLFKKYPQITLLGNYIPGASVSDCVQKAKEEAEMFCNKL